MTQKKEESPELRYRFNRLFEIIPFDSVPGGDLTYTYKKKDDKKVSEKG